MPLLKAIDVRSSTAAGAIVAFGDSITDGTCTTVDGHDRWEDLLAVRLRFEGGRDFAVVNEGIGGNTLTGEFPRQQNGGALTTPGRERLDRDVLSHAGITHVILFMGTNDLRRGARAPQVIAGMEDLAKRVKARRLKAYAVTIIPRHLGGFGWTAENNQDRLEVNNWLRTKAPFDAILDFDRAVRDPADPNLLNPAFNCGDGVHPSLRGYYELASAVPLKLFVSGPAAAPQVKADAAQK
jgi:lysophospholipase L1-like esterase